MAEQSEQSLIGRARKGDAGAFEALVRRHEGKIYNLLLGMTGGNRAEASDLFQETFLSAWKNLRGFRGKSSFSTWLYRIAFNAALMRKRKKKLPTVSLDQPLERDEDRTRLDTIGDWSENPLASLENRELRDRLSREIERLPEPYKQVLVLSDLQGLPNGKIAKVLGISLPNVKSRLHRARLQLRRELSEHFKERS